MYSLLRHVNCDVWMYLGIWRNFSYSLKSYCVTHLSYLYWSCVPRSHWCTWCVLLVYSDILSIWYITIGPLYLLSTMSSPQISIVGKGSSPECNKHGLSRGNSISVKLSPSLQTPQRITKAQMEAMRATANFHYKFFVETKSKVTNMEQDIKQKI